MTTIRAEGLSAVQGDVRKFGIAKEGLIARQFMLGVVQTVEGLPIYYEVFDGNTAEAKTLVPILNKVMARFPALRRLIVVADRGLLSLDNLEEFAKLALPSGQALEFVLAVPCQVGATASSQSCWSRCSNSAVKPVRRSPPRWPGAGCVWWWPMILRRHWSSSKSAKQR